MTAAYARRDGCELNFLTIAYGQRHVIEVERARAVGRAMGVTHHLVLSLDLRAIGGSALTGDLAVPKGRSDAERDTGIPVTYVPARNAIFLSLALAYAEVLDARAIYFGANVLDYSGYPDCRPEFIEAFETMARIGTRAGSTGCRIEVRAPLLRLSKADIVKAGLALHAPLHLTHSCYDPVHGDLACGRCDSCLIRRKGFQEAGVVDPIRYAIP